MMDADFGFGVGGAFLWIALSTRGAESAVHLWGKAPSVTSRGH
eukprot:CAMPEP_0115766500 /NCGR_PEP_ID=MMETSP0272-20121206/103168_1 /TAXON_ID=71861 /ORGANISM="Scrippsiella trochoidea, Strain CCMP3099" /LENGTH=42 /DNA_ID= /DNA_START= /DNA_END= /DNA_ORIENTATION=